MSIHLLADVHVLSLSISVLSAILAIFCLAHGIWAVRKLHKKLMDTQRKSSLAAVLETAYRELRAVDVEMAEFMNEDVGRKMFIDPLTRPAFRPPYKLAFELYLRALSNDPDCSKDLRRLRNELDDQRESFALIVKELKRNAWFAPELNRASNALFVVSQLRQTLTELKLTP